MFTLQQMKAAHAKVKSGSDFPAYVQEIKALGLLNYEYFVNDGHTVYHGANGFNIDSNSIYAAKKISTEVAAYAIKQIIAEHQQGKTDFLTFCSQVASAGIEKWKVDTQAMLCSYFDHLGNSIVSEAIPDSGY